MVEMARAVEAPSLGLALSGGAARGAAHVGVLDVLERAGIRPRYIAGTSSGALVAALYAGGVSPFRLAALARSVKWRHLTRFTFSRRGPIEAHGIEQLVRALLGGRRFEELDVELAVVAVDLVTGRKVVLRSGDVGLAVKASCSVPGIFRPVRIDGGLLADGGVLDNVPVGVVRSMGADVVAAVDVTSYLGDAEPRTGFRSVMRAFEIMQRQNVERELAGADVVIQPRLDGFSVMALDRAEEMIEAGRRAAEESLDGLQALLEGRA